MIIVNQRYPFAETESKADDMFKLAGLNLKEMDPFYTEDKHVEFGAKIALYYELKSETYSLGLLKKAAREDCDMVFSLLKDENSSARDAVADSNVSDSIKIAFGIGKDRSYSREALKNDSRNIIRSFAMFESKLEGTLLTQKDINRLEGLLSKIDKLEKLHDERKDELSKVVEQKEQCCVDLGNFIFETSKIGEKVFRRNAPAVSKEFRLLRLKKKTKTKTEDDKTKVRDINGK